jgi:excisionase family DNA binding protein
VGVNPEQITASHEGGRTLSPARPTPKIPASLLETSGTGVSVSVFKSFSRRLYMPRLLKPREAAEYLGLSYETLIELVHNGEVPACKVGGTWRIPEDALRKSIEDRVAARSAVVGL